MKDIFFSFCVPTYNRSKTIIRTLKSIYEQKFDSYEVLIIDDGSTDNTYNVIKKYLYEIKDNRFYYYKKTNGGKYTALNYGISKAKGAFFIILDSDDWLSNESVLSNLFIECLKIKDNNLYCGVIGKSLNSKTGKRIDDLFIGDSISYIDIHYNLMFSNRDYNDCFEANKLEILKKYCWPENEKIKFIPEAYVFDQIGLDYKLLTSNVILKTVEYLSDGITMDSNFKTKNAAGFLYYYVLKIEKIIPSIRLNFIKKTVLYIIAWYQYWTCVKYDNNSIGPRVSRFSFIGLFVKILFPLLNVIYNEIKRIK